MRAQEDQIRWKNAELIRTGIEQRVGLSDNGSVPRSDYDSAVRTNQELFEAWTASVDIEELDDADPTDIWPIGQDKLKGRHRENKLSI